MATSETDLITRLSPTSPWQDRAKDKKDRVLASIPQEFVHDKLQHSLEDMASVQHVPETLLNPEELYLTALPVTALLSALAKREYTAVQVLNAYTHRAAIAHKLLHCCLDIPYPLSLARAKDLDTHLARTGSTVGPLHGLPISIKDQCRMVGTETTCGFVHPLNTPDDRDAVIVSMMQDAGAIPFAKTSLSMGCMWGETVNNTLGRTSNPFNRTFSCGGSSGGEGALVGFGASPLGIGSDLGGSIRSPSAYQGLYGLRPSVGRLPYYGMRNSMEGELTVQSVCGPMTQSIDGVEIFTKAIVDGKPWLRDPQCCPLPWKQDIVDDMVRPGKKLRVGIFDYDGVCLPQPPIRNAIKEVTALLEQAGHEIVPFKLDTVRATDLILRVFRSDAAGDIERQCAISGETMLENACQRDGPPLTLLEDRDIAMDVLNFRTDMLKVWNATGTEDGKDPIDVYLSPVNPAVVPRHGDYSQVRYFAYTAICNVLDLAACTLPVRVVDPKIDKPDGEGLLNDCDGGSLPEVSGERDEAIRKRYIPEVYNGMPVTLQVVGRRLEEETVVGAVKMISKLLGGGNGCHAPPSSSA